MSAGERAGADGTAVVVRGRGRAQRGQPHAEDAAAALRTAPDAAGKRSAGAAAATLARDTPAATAVGVSSRAKAAAASVAHASTAADAAGARRAEHVVMSAGVDLPPVADASCAPVVRVGRVEEKYSFNPERDEVGDGAYSVVFKARRRDTGAQVAIKRVDIARTRSGASASKTVVDPLEAEVRILASLNNPLIVKLFEVIRDPEGRYMYIVQELVTGGELFHKVAGKGKLTEAQARGLFQQLFVGVAYLHSQGVTHRDLKPENVLLQPFLRERSSQTLPAASAPAEPPVVEKRYVVKITDFGMAHMQQRTRVHKPRDVASEAQAHAEDVGDDGDTFDDAGVDAAGSSRPASACAPHSRMRTVVGTEMYLALELRARHEGYDGDTFERTMETHFERWLRVRGVLRVPPEPLRSRVPDAQPRCTAIPLGFHFRPTHEDYVAIAHALREGYNAAVDSWSLGVMLVRAPLPTAPRPTCTIACCVPPHLFLH
ncbi:hypothetical protein EON68_02500, partial [archaeon]